MTLALLDKRGNICTNAVGYSVEISTSTAKKVNKVEVSEGQALIPDDLVKLQVLCSWLSLSEVEGSRVK